METVEPLGHLRVQHLLILLLSPVRNQLRRIRIPQREIFLMTPDAAVHEADVPAYDASRLETTPYPAPPDPRQHG